MKFWDVGFPPSATHEYICRVLLDFTQKKKRCIFSLMLKKNVACQLSMINLKTLIISNNHFGFLPSDDGHHCNMS